MRVQELRSQRVQEHRSQRVQEHRSQRGGLRSLPRIPHIQLAAVVVGSLVGVQMCWLAGHKCWKLVQGLPG